MILNHLRRGGGEGREGNEVQQFRGQRVKNGVVTKMARLHGEKPPGGPAVQPLGWRVQGGRAGYSSQYKPATADAQLRATET